MADRDLKQHVNSSLDFYGLLELETTATEAEIRRAYRLTARKYHPDKVGASNKEALEKFHDLQIAYGILSDEALKQQYDNFRRARDEQKAREAAYSDDRKTMIEKLLRAETAGKRKREELDEQEAEHRRLAADGRRRREELQAKRQAERAQAEALNRQEEEGAVQPTEQFSDADRTIELRYQKGAGDVDAVRLERVFSNYGEIEAVTSREKRIKPPGGKHREDYVLCYVLYKSLVGANAAVRDFEELKARNDFLGPVESATWLAPQKHGNGTAAGTTVPEPTLREAGKTPKFSFNPKLVGKAS